jgi:hypothetical protein
MQRSHLIRFALLVLLAACGSDGSGPDELEQGSMSARIDGSNWSATAALSAVYSGGLLTAAGLDASLRTIGFSVGATAPGTFVVGLTGTAAGTLTEGSGGPTWQAVANLGEGTITITSISQTAAAGTFSFTLVATAGSGATGTRTVTNGSFNLRF